MVTLSGVKLKLIVAFSISVLCLASFASATQPARAQQPLFSVVLGAPTNNPARIAWAGIIANSFKQVGIDAKLSLGGWDVWIPRVFSPTPDTLGKTYDEGGWDIFFVGWAMGVTPDPTSLYHSESFPPTGYNYVLWNDSYNDQLIEQILTEMDDDDRNDLLRQWQIHFMEESPKAILLYPKSAWAYDPDLEYFEDMSYTFPSPGDPGFRLPDEDTFIVGQNADPIDYNPVIYGSYYDIVAWAPCYEPLFRYNSSDDYFSYTMTPALAERYEVSDDYLNWTIHLRDDVYWPTGFRFNASDLVLTYQAYMTPAVGSFAYADFQAAGLTNSSIIIVDEFTVKVVFPEPYAYAKFLLNVMPISWAAMKDVPWDEWRTHGSNTGEHWVTTDVNGNPYDVYGPLGLGPYVCHTSDSGWDPITRSFTCIRRDQVPGFGTASNPDPGYYKGTKGFRDEDMPEKYVAITISSADAAISALQTGEIDLVDAQFQIQSKIGNIDPAWGEVLVELELGLQEMGFNMQHPVFGTGEATPLGQSDPSRAAEAAKYVRQALNYLIPRQAIIDQILDGFGEPGITFICPLLPAYDPSIQPYSYNVEEAIRLLRLAGYTIETYVPPPPIALYAAVGVAAVAIIVAIFAIWKWKKAVPG